MKRRGAAWIWAAELWALHPARTLERALQYNLETLFIGLECEEGQVCWPDHLRSFIRNARAAGISVRAVEGDPDMLFGAGQGNALKRAEAIARYQSNSSTSDQLDGIQYDIEPYTRDGFDIASPSCRGAWAETAALLHEILGTKLDHVLPFWLAATPSGCELIKGLASTASSLTVMAYRTRRRDIVDGASPMLAIGASLGIPVRVALECGPSAERALDSSSVYGPATTNTAFPPRRRTESPSATLISSNGIRVERDQVSFEGDSAAMFAIADEVEDDLAIWPSFGGFAFHGLF